MQIQLTISDAIAQQALQYGLLEPNNIETLLINELNRRKTKTDMQQWQATIAELAGAWGDFPDADQLRADLITEQQREPL
ncbi:MAG: hypothetical protein ACXW0T_14055 [Methylobacter sp.]